jgi:uncharacterized protein YgbK (DUF1537 family)
VGSKRGPSRAPRRAAATRLRLLADDLTGALDAAAQFTGSLGAVTVRFLPDDAGAGEACLAYDSATRALQADEAGAAMTVLADFFDGAPIAFKKVDSLLRGHPAVELAASFGDGGFRSAVVAPAFPAQGRATRHGVQHVRGLDGAWSPVAPAFADELVRLDLPVRRVARADTISGAGLFLCDAETDADLAAIAAAGARLAPPVLWCGSAGLAAALAGTAPPRKPVPPAPLLAIIGSHHAVGRAQVERFREAHPELWIAIGTSGAEADEVQGCLEEDGAAVVTFALPDAVSAAEAARRIAGIAGALLRRIDPPVGLFVSGGDTLRTVAEALRAEAFVVNGEVVSGVPSSRLVGGRWDGARVVSKSGAFGATELLVRLIAARGGALL